MLCKYNII